MAKYGHFLGKRVAVQYRLGDIYLPTTAKLVADSGKSIFLEELISQGDRIKAFRWEIPYASLLQIAECSEIPSKKKRSEPPAADSAPAAEWSFLPLRNRLKEA